MGSYASNLQSLQQLQQEALQEALPIYQQNAAGGSATASSSASRANTITGLLGASNADLPATPGTTSPLDGNLLSSYAAILAGTGVGSANTGMPSVTSAAQANPLATTSPKSGSFWGSFWSIPTDAVFILIGIVFIGVGLFMFKSTQTLIETGGRAAAGAAKIAAA